MASNVSKVKKAFKVFEKQIDNAERNFLLFSVGISYKAIMRNWPVYSGFSKANNRINVGGGDIARIEPNRRIAKKDLFVAKALNIKASQLAKLARIPLNKNRKNRTIIIGNAVNYAADVGFTSGRGSMIYQEALQEAFLTLKTARSTL